MGVVILRAESETLPMDDQAARRPRKFFFMLEYAAGNNVRLRCKRGRSGPLQALRPPGLQAEFVGTDLAKSRRGECEGTINSFDFVAEMVDALEVKFDWIRSMVCHR